MHTKSIILISLFISITVFATGCFYALAHEGSGPEAIHDILGIAEPSLLPDSSFYFFKNIGRSIRLLFTFDQVKKAELELHFSDEKLAELGKITATSDDKTTLEHALENYIDSHKRLEDRLESLKGKNKNIDTLLEKLADRVLEHEKLFTGLGDKFDERDRERVSRGIAEESKRALELDEEKFKEKLKNKIKEHDADDLEGLEALEDLIDFDKELEKQFGNLGEDLKETVENAKKRSQSSLDEAKKEFRALQEKLKSTTVDLKSSTENLFLRAQEKIKEAETRFEDEKFGNSFGISNASRELIENALRQLGLGAQEKEKNIKECGPIPGAPGNWVCSDGEWKLILPLPSIRGENKYVEPVVCTKEYQPVCGSDNKTHGNACEAKAADVSVVYNGECRIAAIVTITLDGLFSPQTIKVKKGTKVTWVNKGEIGSWPASDPHPIHTLYPGFDSLHALKTGEEYSFVFDKEGTWSYHDHTNARVTGVVEVEE